MNMIHKKDECCPSSIKYISFYSTYHEAIFAWKINRSGNNEYPGIILTAIFFIFLGLVLNSFIRHYEPAYFSKEHLAHQRATTNVKAQLHKKSSRRKRETHSQFYEDDDHAKSEDNFRSFSNERYHKPIKFNFTAHNR